VVGDGGEIATQGDASPHVKPHHLVVVHGVCGHDGATTWAWAQRAAWGDQARRELRASGESSSRRDRAARDQLTAQELQIAQLAAQGLSNRDIAQRLYLSRRTISTHLYRALGWLPWV
jgi:DNA-binding CsgD family transcriptional regulator